MRRRLWKTFKLLLIKIKSVQGMHLQDIANKGGYYINLLDWRDLEKIAVWVGFIGIQTT